MNPPPLPSSRAPKIWAFVVVALVVGALLLWRHGRSRVSPADVAAFLNSTVGSGHVRFEVQKVDALQKDDAGVHVAVAAKAWPVEPLFSSVDTADYLRRAFQLDPDSAADARRLLANKAGAKNPAYASARPFPADPYLAAILSPASSPESGYSFQGIIDAHGSAGAWTLSLVSGGFEGTGPLGEPRSTFGAVAFVAGDAKDEARLRSLVGDFQAFTDRVTAIRRTTEAAHASMAEARRSALLALIGPGRVFAGKALEAGEQNGTAVYLEFTGFTADNGVTALLRNEGGWNNARQFQGTWSADEDFKALAVALASPLDQAVRNAGPLLENTQNWAIELRMDARGDMSGQSRYFTYRFQPILPVQVPALKARLEAEFDQAVAATQPDSLYQGTVTSGASGKSETVLLRFTTNSGDGRSVGATLESAGHPWKRRLRGAIIDNARRSHGAPLRMQTGAKDAVEDAPPDSVLGDQDDLDLSLGWRAGALVGEDGHFTYQLAGAGETDLHALEAGRAERARRFAAIVRAGIAYDGTLHEDQGFITHARLEFDSVDPKTGAVTASMRSLARSGVFREFTGTIDPSEGSMSLATGARGFFGEQGSFDAPFLAGPIASTLHLELTGTSLVGRIEGNPHWTMEFPAATFLSAVTEGTGPDQAPDGGSVFPAFPKAVGAYLLEKGAWLPLPRNQGHIVTETVRPKSEMRLPPSIVGAVNAGIAELTKEGEKKNVTYLEFPGKDARPVSTATTMVILFVGLVPAGSPPVELAQSEVQKDGQRWIELPAGSGTEIRLGEQRVAAYVRKIGPALTLFTTTATPAAGSYVFNADTGYEVSQE